MFIALFFLFCFAVILFGLGYVFMTLRHHKRQELLQKQNAILMAKASALADERLP